MAINIKRMTHAQLENLISEARKRQNELASERVGKVREQIQSLLQAEGLTMKALMAKPAKASPRKGRKLGKVKPKYRNPDDASQTWAGRGKRPRWFSAALAAGKKEKDLLV